MAVVIEALNVGKGDKEIHVEDTTPEQRDVLADEVMSLMKKGFALFLIQGQESRQIRGYDKETHQWIVLSDPTSAPKKAATEKVSAKDTKAKAVGQNAGG